MQQHTIAIVANRIFDFKNLLKSINSLNLNVKKIVFFIKSEKFVQKEDCLHLNTNGKSTMDCLANSHFNSFNNSVTDGLNKSFFVLSKENVIKNRSDFAFLLTDEATTKEYAALFSALGSIVIDNSLAFNDDPHVPLVDYDLNSKNAFTNSGIICVPLPTFCCLRMVVYPLLAKFGLKRLASLICINPQNEFNTFLNTSATNICNANISSPDKQNLNVFLDCSKLQQATANQCSKLLGEDLQLFNINILSNYSIFTDFTFVNIQLQYAGNEIEILKTLQQSGFALTKQPDNADIYKNDDILLISLKRDYSKENSFNILLQGSVNNLMHKNMVKIAKLLI